MVHFHFLIKNALLAYNNVCLVLNSHCTWFLENSSVLLKNLELMIIITAASPIALYMPGVHILKLYSHVGRSWLLASTFTLYGYLYVKYYSFCYFSIVDDVQYKSLIIKTCPIICTSYAVLPTC